MKEDFRQFEAAVSHLDNFSDAVNSEVNEQIDGIIKTAEEERSTLLNKANDEALQLAYDKIKKEVKLISAKYFKIAAKAELETKKQALRYREELIVDLFKSIEDKLISFRNSDKYESYLVKRISSQKIDSGAIVYIAPFDSKYKNSLLKNLPKDCKVEEDNTIKLGGLSIYYPESNLIVDKTIDSALKEERAEFNRKNCFSLD